MRMLPFMKKVRSEQARLCEALGVDPGQVVDVEWTAARPNRVQFVMLDVDPATGRRRREDHPVPEGWRP